MNLDPWLAALDERHLANLTPAEVTRALRALSSCYVERREKLATGGALDGAGKRAAFALFYGPQHFFITREVVRAIRAGAGRPAAAAPDAALYQRVIDLGCGTGTAGAATAIEAGGAAIQGFDLNPWAVSEANWTYRALGLRGRATIANITKMKVPASAGTLVLAAYTVNELPGRGRQPLLDQLKAAHAAGAAVLVIEPIGRRVNLWWDEWAEAFVAAGGRHDDWRFQVALPPRQRALAKAAGLDVQALTARSLYMSPPT
ncbi:MAG TPA: methyltransferase domain-containing protein [Vicinamibacterales bacterium]|nr:methyltransferase domain-containing protein [Vicinamibacterales bacterium]